MSEMQAAVDRRYGGPEVLQAATIAAPVPAAGELLVRVAAASVNGYDALVRSGALSSGSTELGAPADFTRRDQSLRARISSR